MRKKSYWIFGIIIILILGYSFAVGGRSIDDNIIQNEADEIIPVREDIIEKLAASKTIIVKNTCGEETQNNITLKKIITDTKVIKDMIKIIKEGREARGDVTNEGSCRDMELYNKDGKQIGIIKSFNARISFENDYYYSCYIDMKAFNELIEN